MSNPFITKLGYPADSRLVVFHADDVGMCHGANQAFLELVEFGIVKSGSIMLPCSWSAEILAACRVNPALDLGVHLTLTSEWSGYRWGPLSTRDHASGLIDDEGWFWHRTAQVRTAMQVEAAIAEMRAQVEMADHAGVAITHLDAHMGAAYVPELLAHYVALGVEWQVPLLLMRQGERYHRMLGLDSLDPSAWAVQVEQWQALGLPIFDNFLITPDHHPAGPTGNRGELYEAALHELSPGTLTFFSLHPNTPADIAPIVWDRPHWTLWRTFEYDYFRSDRLRSFLAQEGIIPIGFRELRDVLRG